MAGQNAISPGYSPEAIFETVNQLTRHAQPGCEADEKRISDRVTIYAPVQIQMLDEAWQPVSAQMSAISRDLSVGGIGLLCERRLESDRVAIQFDEFPQLSPLAVQIKHQQEIGPFVAVGGSFYVDWDSIDV